MHDCSEKIHALFAYHHCHNCSNDFYQWQLNKVICVICNLLLVHLRSSQSLHWKKVDHATSQFLLNQKMKKSAWEVAMSCRRKFCCCDKNAPQSSLCPACPCFPSSSLRYDLFSGEMCLTFPLSPLFSWPALLWPSVDISIPFPLYILHSLVQTFLEWRRSYFLFLIGLTCLYRVGFQGGYTALNQTLLLHTCPSALW